MEKYRKMDRGLQFITLFAITIFFLIGISEHPTYEKWKQIKNKLVISLKDLFDRNN